MAWFRSLSVASACLIALAPPASAGGPGGVVDTGVMSRAVGSGVRDGLLIGFTAAGPTNEMAAQAVISTCRSAGADQCSSDEQTNDVFCIVSVGADDGSGVVSGGAGTTVEAARDDAFRHVTEANLTLDASARILASSCP